MCHRSTASTPKRVDSEAGAPIDSVETHSASEPHPRPFSPGAAYFVVNPCGLLRSLPVLNRRLCSAIVCESLTSSAAVFALSSAPCDDKIIAAAILLIDSPKCLEASVCSSEACAIWAILCFTYIAHECPRTEPSGTRMCKPRQKVLPQEGDRWSGQSSTIS